MCRNIHLIIRARHSFVPIWWDTDEKTESQRGELPEVTARNGAGAQARQSDSRAHESKCLGKGQTVHLPRPKQSNRQLLTEVSLPPVWGPAPVAMAIGPRPTSILPGIMQQKPNSKCNSSRNQEYWFSGFYQSRKNWNNLYLTGYFWGIAGGGQALTGGSGSINRSHTSELEVIWI